jgi:hypothetical protein
MTVLHPAVRLVRGDQAHCSTAHVQRRPHLQPNHGYFGQALTFCAFEE